MNSFELAVKIFDCVSDRYDDEEYREKVIDELYDELSQINNDSVIKSSFTALCERVEELET